METDYALVIQRLINIVAGTVTRSDIEPEESAALLCGLLEMGDALGVSWDDLGLALSEAGLDADLYMP